MKYVVINADDLGIARSTNDAIFDAARNGILTSASLMANMPAFDHAVDGLQDSPELGVGAHLCLTSGRPVLPARWLSTLCDGSGEFRRNFGSLLFHAGMCRRKQLLQEIRDEWQAQLNKIAAAGIEIDHIDSHQHVHAIPGVFEILLELAEQYPNVWIRCPRERAIQSVHPRPLSGTIKRWILSACLGAARSTNSRQMPDAFYGVQHSGDMNADVLRQLAAVTQAGVTEIITHPGAGCDNDVICSETDRRFLAAENRQLEWDALKSPAVRQAFADANCELSTFRGVPSGAVVRVG